MADSKKTQAMALARGLHPWLTRSKATVLLNGCRYLSHRVPFPVEDFFTADGIKVATAAVTDHSKATGKTERWCWPHITGLALYGLGLLKRERQRSSHKGKVQSQRPWWSRKRGKKKPRSFAH